MPKAIPASKVTLYDLEQHFQLQQTRSSSFFLEWQTELPVLTDIEKHRLERVQASVENLERRSLLENTVKLAVLAPLLDLAGLFLPPFYVSTEESVEIEATDDSLTIQGRIDILALKEQLWVLVIESKRAEFSPKVGIPQALSYMLANPNREFPLYGLVTNGTDFVFLKLEFSDAPSYAKSRQFILGQDQDLETVLRIIKSLANIVSEFD